MLLALAFIPVLLLIHALRPKPSRIEVTGLYLWQEVLKERSVHVRFKRFRRNLPLLLQILIVILTSLAMAGPVRLYATSQEGDMILVVDTSASMKTRAGNATRFDLAKEKAIDLIDRRSSGRRVLIIEAGRKPVLNCGFLTDTKRLRQHIQDLQAADTSGSMEAAVYLALSFVDPKRNDTVYLVTDGAGGDLSALLKLHPLLKPIIVSGGENSVGITKFEFRQQPGRTTDFEILLEVKHFIPAPVECPIRISIGGSVIADTRIAFEGIEKKLLIFPYSGPVAGIARASVNIDDDFMIDNTAYLSFSPRKDIWVSI